MGVGVAVVCFCLCVFITKCFMHISLINVHADSNARDPNFKPGHHLHPYFVYASSECYRYQNACLLSPIYFSAKW